ncbi:hypothetical protein EGW08_006824 [Elysia chlorotica]|uniref:G-protein coupled receptors family 1 profile domain-containing protein n=1 Tax=Elysia chlorotica TaxID=188477 RepID=A0A433TV45_ELYCH|nr:hypothetical protein EGW08_006824 [Elysia chlorotica]
MPQVTGAFGVLVKNYSVIIPSLSTVHSHDQSGGLSQSVDTFQVIGLTTTISAHNGSTFSISTNIANTDTTDLPSDAVERPLVATILIGLALALLVILTITGNVLVIASVALHSNLRTTTNYFIANLAIADLLLGTTVLPFSATWEVLQYWVFGQIFCDIWAAIDVLCCTASILSLCVISIDRYIGVTRPLQHARIMRHARAVYVIVCVWLLSLIISVAPLIGWKEAPHPDPRVCTVTTQPGYVLFSVAGSFYIPCLIILGVYFRIYQETVKYTRCLKAGAKTARVDQENVVSLRIHMGPNVRYDGSGRQANPGFQQPESSGRHGSQQPDSSVGSNNEALDNYSIYDLNNGLRGKSHHSGSNNAQLPKKGRSSSSGIRVSRLTLSNKIARFKREKKAAKTLGIVVGVFITCWLPFFIILPLDSLCPDCYVPPLLFKLFFWLGYCNSTMNPIIYTCSSREFRRAFLSTLSCARCYRQPGTPLTGLQLRALNHNTAQCRGLLRQQNNAFEAERREDVLLELSRSKKSNSSGSSTFNATSIDHKSSSGGSPTPKDVEETNCNGSNISHSPMIPRSYTPDGTSQTLKFEDGTNDPEHTGFIQNSISNNDVLREFANNPCNSRNHKDDLVTQKYTCRGFEDGITEYPREINQYIQLSTVTSVAPTPVCKYGCNKESIAGSSSISVQYPSASVASGLDSTSIRYSVPVNPSRPKEFGHMDGMSNYSLAETISCSD